MSTRYRTYFSLLPLCLLLSAAAAFGDEFQLVEKEITAKNCYADSTGNTFLGCIAAVSRFLSSAQEPLALGIAATEEGQIKVAQEFDSVRAVETRSSASKFFEASLTTFSAKEADAK